eukprot:300571-Chlamydomonas_euryale.AAC.12
MHTPPPPPPAAGQAPGRRCMPPPALALLPTHSLERASAATPASESGGRVALGALRGNGRASSSVKNRSGQPSA